MAECFSYKEKDIGSSPVLPMDLLSSNPATTKINIYYMKFTIVSIFAISSLATTCGFFSYKWFSSQRTFNTSNTINVTNVVTELNAPTINPEFVFDSTSFVSGLNGVSIYAFGLGLPIDSVPYFSVAKYLLRRRRSSYTFDLYSESKARQRVGSFSNYYSDQAGLDTMEDPSFSNELDIDLYE